MSQSDFRVNKNINKTNIDKNSEHKENEKLIESIKKDKENIDLKIKTSGGGDFRAWQ